MHTVLQGHAWHQEGQLCKLALRLGPSAGGLDWAKAGGLNLLHALLCVFFMVAATPETCLALTGISDYQLQVPDDSGRPQYSTG